MKTNKVFSGKKILALILALVMAFSVVPVAFAAESDFLNEPGQLISSSGGWRTDVWYVNVFFSSDLSSRGDNLNVDGSLNYTFVQMQDDDKFKIDFTFGMVKNSGFNYGRLWNIEEKNFPAAVAWKNVEGGVGDTPYPCDMPGNLFTGAKFLKWYGTIDFAADGSKVYNGEITVNFDAGESEVKKGNYTQTIPVTITVIDKRPLLNAIIAAYDKKDDLKYCTEDSVLEYNVALEAAEAIAPAATLVTQEQVTSVTAALNDAVAALKYQEADYADLNAAKADAKPIIDDEKADEKYTADSLKVLREKYNAAAAIADGLNVSHQPEIDKAAKELADAVKALEKFADYSKLERAVKLFDNLESEYFDPAAYAEVKALADAAKEALKPENRLPESEKEKVDNQANELLKAIAKLNTQMLPADYSELEAALEEGKAKLFSSDIQNYTQITVKALEDACLAGDKLPKTYKKNNQSKVDAATQAIRDAIDGLKFKDAKYDKLNAAIAEADATLKRTDICDYTDESVQVLRDALAAARAVAPDLDMDQQAVIDKATEDLNTAIRELVIKLADYSELDEVIAKRQQELADARKNGKFTEASMTRLEIAINLAIKFDRTHSIKEQGLVDEAVRDLKAVKLEKRAAVTDELKAAIETAQDTLNKAGDEYTDESKAALSEAIKKAREVLNQYGGDIDNQGVIDNAVEDLKAVKLELKKANYDLLNESIKRAEDFLADPETETLYTPEAIQKVKDALEEAKKVAGTDYTIKEQGIVDKAKNDLEDAMPGDSDYKAANLDELIAAIESADEKLSAEDIADYTEESVADLRAARDDAQAMVDRKPSIKEQEDVNIKAAALKAMKLTLKKADYSKLEAAVVQANLDYEKYQASGLYTEASLEKMMEAIIYANALLENQNLTIRDQSVVDKAVKDLKVDLVYKDADLKDLKAAIEAAQAKIAAPGYENYTPASRQAFEEALAAAIALCDSNPDITKQDDVKAAADKLNNFKLSLEGADYKVLDQYIDEAKGLLETNLSDKFTNASIDAMKAALAEAENIDRNLDVSDQEYVDTVAQALRDAIDSLEPYNKVTGVQITQNGVVVDGDVAYVKVPWYKTYKSQSTILGYQLSGDVDVASVKWELANWSVDNPEAEIIDNGDGTITVKPNGKGIGARSCWVKVIVTDSNGNTVEDYVKVRFYNWNWQK